MFFSLFLNFSKEKANLENIAYNLEFLIIF